MNPPTTPTQAKRKSPGARALTVIAWLIGGFFVLSIAV